LCHPSPMAPKRFTLIAPLPGIANAEARPAPSALAATQAIAEVKLRLDQDSW
jgi:hypothetical protein